MTFMADAYASRRLSTRAAGTAKKENGQLSADARQIVRRGRRFNVAARCGLIGPESLRVGLGTNELPRHTPPDDRRRNHTDLRHVRLA